MNSLVERILESYGKDVGRNYLGLLASSGRNASALQPLPPCSQQVGHQVGVHGYEAGLTGRGHGLEATRINSFSTPNSEYPAPKALSDRPTRG